MQMYKSIRKWNPFQGGSWKRPLSGRCVHSWIIPSSRETRETAAAEKRKSKQKLRTYIIHNTLGANNPFGRDRAARSRARRQLIGSVEASAARLGRVLRPDPQLAPSRISCRLSPDTAWRFVGRGRERSGLCAWRVVASYVRLIIPVVSRASAYERVRIHAGGIG